MDLDTAYAQGARAYGFGLDLEHCPYLDDDGAREDWEAGWWDANEFAAEDFERGAGPAWAEF